MSGERPDLALHILVVEDNDDLRDAIVDALAHQGHHVRGVDCAEAVPELAERAGIDVMVVDLNLPGEDGMSLARRLRAVQPGLGIVMLTARSLTEDKSAGYRSGADLYLTKPASAAELHAAIQALARRLRPQGATAGSLELDLRRLMLQGPAGRTLLTANEVLVLAALCRAPDRRLERWQLLQCLGHHEADYSKPAFEMLIARLRKKLQSLHSEEDKPIRSVRGVGYQLCVDVRLS
jgi:DNA-binding response OmpR family regulator